jgi:hypothetical protein
MKYNQVSQKNEYKNTLREKINELDIKSEKDWDEFVKKEELGQSYSEKWLKQIKYMAEKGRIFDIDLEKLPYDKRFEANHLLQKLEAELRTLKYGTPVGYSDLYIIISILTSLIGLIFGVAGALRAFENKIQYDEKTKKFVKQLRNPPKILKWIKSVVDMIKK